VNKDERDAKIEEYGGGYKLLTAALAEIPREAWDFKPSGEDWSVHEILVHMGDSESMAALRARKLIVEPGTRLMDYQEAKWAGALDYQHQDVECALDIIRLARETTYRLLKTLPEQAFSHSVVHPEYADPYTFDQWLRIYSHHITDHIEQMKKAVAGWTSKEV
jgi:hypothetical protein